jgi:hypothetical protein
MRVWTIRELLTSQELFLEGRVLRHCVATYAVQCAKKLTSIWSMQLENCQGKHRVVTIELDLANRMICQARMKCNKLPQAAEMEVITMWAAQEGLRIAESVRL